MKIKILVVIILGLFLVLGLSGIENSNLEKIAKDGYEKGGKEGALHFMDNFKNNSFDGERYDLHLKNADIGKLIPFFSKIANFEFVPKLSKKMGFTCKLKEIPWDLLLTLIIYQKNLKVKLIKNDTAILITDE